MLEQYLVEHCSPTLAGLKTANLFSVRFTDEEELNLHMKQCEKSFQDKGVSLILLRKKAGTALIYVCRREKLQKDLQKNGVKEFLKKYGYENTDVEEAIACLKTRLNLEEKFPHEIGLFLGYPLGDVIGFIENAGKNSKCAGCWKVYCNECETMKLFEKFKKCTRIYTKLWRQGTSVEKLTVAA